MNAQTLLANYPNLSGACKSRLGRAQYLKATFDLPAYDGPQDRFDGWLQDRLDEELIPLSGVDRWTLSASKKRTAQAYYQAARELAEQVVGDERAFEYRDAGLTNADEIVDLWAQQARYGDRGETVKSLPISVALGAVGAIGGTPIEGVKVVKGELTKALATGHGWNPIMNAFSGICLVGAVASLVTGMATFAAPLLGGLAVAGPLLTFASPVLSQRFGNLNAPVHETAHAMQFLLLGDLLNQGCIDSRDFFEIQNDADGCSGYLWGGATEKAAHHAETTGDPSLLFETIRQQGTAHLLERYGENTPKVARLHERMDFHEQWITRAVSRRP